MAYAGLCGASYQNFSDPYLHSATIAQIHAYMAGAGSTCGQTDNTGNANCHLVGINFDRNWEGTMSDLMYDPDMCLNTLLDTCYCLVFVDKFSGAGHLLNETVLVEWDHILNPE